MGKRGRSYLKDRERMGQVDESGQERDRILNSMSSKRDDSEAPSWHKEIHFRARAFLRG